MESSERRVVFLSQRREEPHNTDIQERQTTPGMRLEMQESGSWWWSHEKILGVDFRIRLIDMRPLPFLRFREEALTLTREAMEIAKEGGATDIGLGSLVASIAHGGADLLEDADRLGLRLDHGDDMSTGLAAQMAWTLQGLGLDLKNSTVGIIGAVGLMGAGFAKLLSPFAKRFVLIVRKDDERARRLKAFLEAAGCSVVIANDFDTLRREGCNLVYVAHSSPDMLLRPCNLKPGTLVIDACIPPAVILEEFVVSTHLLIPVGCGVLPKDHAPRGAGVNLGLGETPNGPIVYGCMLGCVISAKLGYTEHHIQEIDPAHAHLLLDEGKKWGIIHQPLPVSEEEVRDFIRARS